jgi:hypothetical protein
VGVEIWPSVRSAFTIRTGLVVQVLARKLRWPPCNQAREDKEQSKGAGRPIGRVALPAGGNDEIRAEAQGVTPA